MNLENKQHIRDMELTVCICWQEQNIDMNLNRTKLGFG